MTTNDFPGVMQPSTTVQLEQLKEDRKTDCPICFRTIFEMRPTPSNKAMPTGLPHLHQEQYHAAEYTEQNPYDFQHGLESMLRLLTLSDQLLDRLDGIPHRTQSAQPTPEDPSASSAPPSPTTTATLDPTDDDDDDNDNDDDDDDEDDCHNPMTLSACNHTFGAACLTSWIRTRGGANQATCPLCRARLRDPRADQQHPYELFPRNHIVEPITLRPLGAWNPGNTASRLAEQQRLGVGTSSTPRPSALRSRSLDGRVGEGLELAPHRRGVVPRGCAGGAERRRDGGVWASRRERGARPLRDLRGDVWR